MPRGQVDPNDLTIGDEAEAVVTHSYEPSDVRGDCYVYMQADGEVVEYHIWASEREAEDLELALNERFQQLGYDDAFETYVEPGGEYKWVMDDTTDIAALAAEIVEDGGFMDQKGGR